MGLSEREKKIIEEMEAALQAEDPKLVATMERRRPSLVVNSVAILIGVATLLAGVTTKVTLVGVAGFLIALLGAATIRFSGKGIKAPRAPKAPGGRMQERWNKRNPN